jgi:hypothetical protein
MNLEHLLPNEAWDTWRLLHVGEGHVSLLVVNVTWIDLDPLASILYF